MLRVGDNNEPLTQEQLDNLVQQRFQDREQAWRVAERDFQTRIAALENDNQNMVDDRQRMLHRATLAEREVEVRQETQRHQDVRENRTPTVVKEGMEEISSTQLLGALSNSPVRTYAGVGHKKFTDWLLDMDRLAKLFRNTELFRYKALQTLNDAPKEFMTMYWEGNEEATWAESRAAIVQRFGERGRADGARVKLNKCTQKNLSIPVFAQELFKHAQEAWPEVDVKIDQEAQKTLVFQFYSGLRDKKVAGKVFDSKATRFDAAIETAMQASARHTGLSVCRKAAGTDYEAPRLEEPMEVDATQAAAAQANSGVIQQVMSVISQFPALQSLCQPTPDICPIGRGHSSQPRGQTPPSHAHTQHQVVEAPPRHQRQTAPSPQDLVAILTPSGTKIRVPRSTLTRKDGKAACYWCTGDHMFRYCPKYLN
jgi:hypothetical protein